MSHLLQRKKAYHRRKIWLHDKITIIFDLAFSASDNTSFSITLISSVLYMLQVLKSWALHRKEQVQETFKCLPLKSSLKILLNYLINHEMRIVPLWDRTFIIWHRQMIKWLFFLQVFIEEKRGRILTFAKKGRIFYTISVPLRMFHKLALDMRSLRNRHSASKTKGCLSGVCPNLDTFQPRLD